MNLDLNNIKYRAIKVFINKFFYEHSRSPLTGLDSVPLNLPINFKIIKVENKLIFVEFTADILINCMDGFKPTKEVYKYTFSNNLFLMSNKKFEQKYPLNTFSELHKNQKYFYVDYWKVPEHLIN